VAKGRESAGEQTKDGRNAGEGFVHDSIYHTQIWRLQPMPAKLEWLKGIFPPLVTAFHRDESIDEEGIRRLVRYVKDKVNGFVTSGTTGEFPYMTVQENRRVLEIVVDEIRGKKPVIAGASAPATRQVIEMALNAKQAGASAVLVTTPYFLHPSPKGCYQHFYELTEAVDIPVVMYNIPQTVGAYLPVDVIEDLSEIPNIVGLKDTSGNLAYTLQVLEKVEGRIDVLVGNDEVAVPSLLSGCSGAILMSANVFPELWQKAYRAAVQGKVEEAMAVQRSVQKVVRIFGSNGAGLAIKAALKMAGIDVGTARRPLRIGGSLLQEVAAEIQLELEKLGKVKPPSAEFAYPSGDPASRFSEVGITPQTVKEGSLRIGSATAGTGVEKVQVDLVTGSKESEIGSVYAEQCTHPRHGYEALTAILEPNLMIRPSTLIIPTVPLKNLRQANMVYGPGQAAVGKAILDGIISGKLPEDSMERDVMLVNLTVHPRALNHHRLYRNVWDAMTKAIGTAYA
jgi:4-hydroxy-tetrahydrodipicolinate synthase